MRGRDRTACASELATAGTDASTSVACMAARTVLAVAALVRDGRVLLVHRRPSRRWYPDCWDLVGGHVERGESPHEAVRRECLEELGIRIHDPRPIAMEVGDPTLDVHAFLVTRWDGDPANVAPEEHDDLGWFQPRDLPDLEMAHPASVPRIQSAIRGAD